MDPSAKIEKKSAFQSEQPSTRENIRVYLVSLADKINHDTDEVPQKKMNAEAELQQLSEEQLEHLNTGTIESIDLPDNIRNTLESVNIRALILEESNRRKQQLKEEISKNPNAPEKPADNILNPTETAENAPKQEVPNEKNKKESDASRIEVPKTPVIAKEEPWLPQSVDPRTWTKRQIATVSTITLGGAALYALWRSLRKPEQKDSSEKSKESGGLKRLLYWIPGVGLAAVVLYAGHKMLMKIDGYAKNFENLEKKFGEMEKKAEGWVEKGKETIRHPLGGGEWEKYGLSKNEYKQAEESYRKTRGTDLTDIRRIFALKDGEKSTEYETFIKNMEKKYETREMNGVTYARANVAICNYENSIEVTLKELGQWIENNSVAIGLTTYALHRTGLLEIQDILRGGGTTGIKALQIGKQLTMMVANHPLISLLTVGGSLLGMKAALSASEHVFIPENFQALGEAFSKNIPIAIGDIGSGIGDQIESLRSNATDLVNMGEDFGVWVGDAIADFGTKIVEETPDFIGLTRQEFIQKRNMYGLKTLKTKLENNQTIAATSTKDIVGKNMVSKYDKALKELEQFTRSFTNERLDKITESTEPEETFEKLREALIDIGVSLTRKDGIVRWRTEGSEEIDLCVDPSIKDEGKIHTLSRKMREGRESDLDYVFFRGIQHLREKQQEGSDRTKELLGTQNKVAAMAIGNFVYFTDIENWGNYFVAPIECATELFGTSWSEYIAGRVEDAEDAAIMTLDMAALSRIKRLAIGGGKLLSNPLSARNWKSTVGTINPLTSPFKLVQDMARGAIDFETFATQGHLKEGGGRFFNQLLGKANIRPEWIGIIENPSSSLEALEEVGGHIKVLRKGETIEKFRSALRYRAMKTLRETRMLDMKQGRAGTVANYADIYRKAAEWYKTRSKFSKIAEKVSYGVDKLKDLPRAAYAKSVQGAAKAVGLTSAAEAVGDVRNFEKFYEEIREARALKDNRKIFDLLHKAADLIKTEAAAGNRTAQAMLLVLRLEKAAKVGGKILLILGPLIDAAMLIVNRFDMHAARKANNQEMLRTLESKEKVLAAQGGIGLSMLLMSGPQALAVAPVALASSVITNNIYNSVVQWETSSRQWLNETPEALKKKYEELEIGYMDSGHKYGIVTHPFARPFSSWGKTSAQVDSEEFKKVEGVNQHVRQEILTAYFLQTMKLPNVPNETQEQYKNRAVVAVKDRLTFVKATTDGTYARGILPDERFFGHAEEYANLASMQRTLDERGEKRVFSYEWNGTMEQLDLSTLDYIRNPRTGNTTKDDQRQMAYLQTARKYREQVLVYGDAIHEMETMAPSIAGQEATKPKTAPEKTPPKSPEKSTKQAA